MKKIILCADDYGYSPEVNNGILQLVQAQRISAVSCLVNTPSAAEIANLLPFSDRIDIGLHFNLTEQLSPNKPAPSSLWKLLIKAKLHQLSQQTIEDAFNRQLDQFELCAKKLPDFIDGHQHVHQLPVVCDAIFRVYAKRLINKPYIRYVNFDLSDFGKRFIINLASDFTFKHKLVKNGIPHNKTFTGIYSFNNKQPYRDLFRSFLKKSQNGALIMSHPGLISKNADQIAQNRQNEFDYFLSNEFLADLAGSSLDNGQRLLSVVKT